jgi:uncharacterized protein (DUF58 family)
LRVRLSIAGWCLIGLSFATLLSGVLANSASAIIVGAALLFVVLLAPPLAFLNLRRLNLQVALPPRVETGVVFPVDITLLNDSHTTPAMFVRVRDQSRPGLVEGTPYICCVAPHDEVVLEGEGRVSTRGIYREASFGIHSGFPFALVDSEIRKTLPIHLVVVPRARDVRIGAHLSSTDSHGHGYVREGLHTMDGDFRSLRDYQAGFPTKLIDWRTTARRMAPVVRELEHPLPRRARIFFHTYRPQHAVIHSRLFEEGLEVLGGAIALTHQNRWHAQFWSDFAPTSNPVAVNRRGDATLDIALASATLPPRHGFGEVLAYLDEKDSQDWLNIVVSNCPQRYWKAEAQKACRGALICLDATGEVA